MRRVYSLVSIIIALISFCSLSFAQTEPAPPATPQASQDAPGVLSLAEGTTARLSLQTRLSSKINEVGDQITAVLYEPLRSSDGRTLVPRGIEFSGRVTQIQTARRPQKQASMTIVFETMHMSYGAEKISTIVTAIDDYANDEKYKSKDDEGKVGGGHSGKRTAGNTAAGAGIGALGGMVMGGLGGLAAAAGVGAVGGVLLTKGNDIRLEPGTVLRVRFEREVKLPALDQP